MASCLGEQVRPAPATRLPVRRPLRIGACPHVPQLLAARDALLGDEALEHQDRKSTRLNSSHGYISYAVFCLKKKKEPNESRLPADSTMKALRTRAPSRRA